MGLSSAAWITVDDTGARHQAKNGFCTHIGNDQFASFTTTNSKSRLNFLEVLLAGDTTHVINEAAIAYMREHNLSGIVINRLAAHDKKSFADRDAWMAHLKELGITALATSSAKPKKTSGAAFGPSMPISRPFAKSPQPSARVSSPSALRRSSQRARAMQRSTGS
jgi:hypothetical protein